jgi:DNA-directed RNA polymerase subunit H (RpoH/RPB5)
VNKIKHKIIDKEEYEEIDPNYKITEEEILRIIEVIKSYEEKGLI